VNTKNALYGALCGALVFAFLSWAAPKKAVNAAALPAPAKGRFEIARMQGNSGSTQGLFLLDTETGCVWNDVPMPIPAKGNGTNGATYLLEGGDNSFSVIAFDTAKFVPGIMSNGETDFSKPIRELQREEKLCDQARVRALEAGAEQ